MSRRTSIDADKSVTMQRDKFKEDYPTWTNDKGTVHTREIMTQGSAVLASEEDIERDELGFTNPNLHRRIADPTEETLIQADDERNQELETRTYQVSIMNVNSYRTTHVNTHDEDSIDNETP